MAAMTPWPLIRLWYCDKLENRLPMPAKFSQQHYNRNQNDGAVPLYCMVAKFRPTRFGNKKSFLSESQVPSPTYMVLEEYVLLPAGLSESVIAATKLPIAARRR